MDRIQSSRDWGNDTGGQDGFETARVPLVTLRRGEGAVVAGGGTTSRARELAHGLSRLGFRAGRSILVVATSIRMTAAHFRTCVDRGVRDLHAYHRSHRERVMQFALTAAIVVLAALYTARRIVHLDWSRASRSGRF